jgi:vitamin B12 transporter
MNRAEEIANYTLGASAGAWQYDVHISYHGKRNNTDFDPITFMPSVVTLDAYTLLSASISYQLNDAVKIYLNASNLTDKEYQEVVHYNTAGREFYLGVDWQLF